MYPGKKGMNLDENVCKAMAVLAEELPLSCVKVRLEVPVSKIYPQGRTREVVLYGENEKRLCG